MEFSRDDLMEAKRRVRAYAKELLQINTPQLPYAAAETFRLLFYPLIYLILSPILLQHHPVGDPRNRLSLVKAGLRKERSCWDKENPLPDAFLDFF